MQFTIFHFFAQCNILAKRHF